MEKQTDIKMDFTKANAEHGEGRVSITTNEAVEYREYKRQRKRAEILSAIANSEGVLSGFEDVKKVRERAIRLRQAAVRMSPERLQQIGEIFTRNAVAVDCTIGGDGETIAKVKAYEARKARRLKARELTLMLSPYSVANCRYEEIRKEINKVRRAAGNTLLKVRVNKPYTPTILSQIARICSESGVHYFCVPYFDGCERLCLELKGGCGLQVSEVDNLSTFKKLRAAGVARIVTSKAWDIYNEWMKEVEKINFPELMAKAEQKQLPAGKSAPAKPLSDGEKTQAPATVGLLPPPTATPQVSTAETLMKRSSATEELRRGEKKEWNLS